MDGIVAAVKIPLSLLQDPARFGGIISGDCLAGDLVIRNGSAVGMTSRPIDHCTAIVTPPLVEPHCHLDKSFTLDRLAIAGSTLLDAIEAQELDKAHWTREDLKARMGRGLSELTDAGCNFVRAHTDCLIDADVPEWFSLAWDVLGELAEEWRGRITIERAALFPVESFTDQALADRVARRIAQDRGVMGAFVYNQPGRENALEIMLRAAENAGIALDFHVDEGLDPGLDNVETIARMALALGHEFPITCSHACSLMNLEGDALEARLELMHAASLTVISLPASNLYLQSRGAGTPDRRGITRIRELRGHGIAVGIGSDNVRDAFSAVGRHDPLASLGLGVIGAHLDPPLGQWLPLVTQEAQHALGHRRSYIEDCPAADLLAWPSAGLPDLISERPKPVRLASLL